jgi:alcohol dehydrogenase class IV
VWGLTEGARKTTGVDARVLPRVIVYDAELTLSLPVPMSVASGLNALAHCGGAAGGATRGLEELRRELSAPRALRDYGFAEADIPAAADAILPAVPPGNPRPVTAGDLRRLLRAAWAGADPGVMATSEESGR